VAIDKTSLGVIGSIGGALLLTVVPFFVWLATIDRRVTVIEETRVLERSTSRQVEDANKESLSRIEHEREANDARVRDDLRELRTRVFK
jgi:hypothetical protein